MSNRTPRIVIDAQPRGPLGPWGWQRVGETTSLSRLVQFAAHHDANEILVHGTFEDTPGNLDIAAEAIPRERALRVTSEPLPSDGFVLRTDRVYDSALLSKAIASGSSPESAVVWRLDVKSDLTAAHDEVTRRTTYQPMGRFWAWQPAKKLAESLQPTWIRPNHVTVAAAACFVAASALVAFGGPWLLAHIATALLLATALVLDTADGHLARRQRTASAFGKWLDATLDEACDAFLHTAIGWSMYVHTSKPLWLVLSAAYIAGKLIFFTSSANAPAMQDAVQPKPAPTEKGELSVAALVRLTAHADVRWHLWIVCALFGWLPWALVAYCAYYPIRAVMVARRWMVRNA